jgi:AAA+ ATPase superfamily predicted ATPase
MRSGIMLVGIMKFIDRRAELARLDALVRAPEGGLAVVYGRRRMGKTRLLVEWCRRHGGIYAVADQSAPEIQRRHLAEAIAQRFPSFADVDYRDWAGLFDRLAREARAASWRGPIVLDELPYWAASSPELASVLQRWIDHAAREAALVVAIAGSSQRMMQGLALDRDAPLFGRARELFEVRPLELPFVAAAIGSAPARRTLEFFAAWGGVPRYWELASTHEGDVPASVEALVLDPSGPLHREPDRLLLEELPSALEVRPVLDAIGAGAHRVSEIAARMGRPATSLARPLDRLVGLGLATREVPFGESERSGRRSLYRIDDPFTRLWFRVVAPHRGELVSGTRRTRLQLLARHWGALVAATWEQLCRHLLPVAGARSAVARAGPWKPASRWWHGKAPEWDLVAEDVEERRLLLGDAKLGDSVGAIRRAASELASRQSPELPVRYRRHEIVRALFVPERPSGVDAGDAIVVSLSDLAGRKRADPSE